HTGYLVPERNSDALAEAIIDLLAHPEKRQTFGRNGFEFAQKTFSWDRIVDDLIMLYEQAENTEAPRKILKALKPQIESGKSTFPAAAVTSSATTVAEAPTA
ncbi:MAG: hypothetical protein AAGA30_18735, partial [Planctomycetota bacterium]